MRKFRASKLDLKQVPKEEGVAFLKENHLQGNAVYQIAYGLYNGDELIQLMAFGTPRFNRNYQYEIIRDCTKKDCIVNGGVSRLWNKFVEDISPVSCICYSYPHNGEFTTKYINYCGFENVEKARPEKKVYFIGTWNGEEKRIDKSLLAKQGADRLLKGDFGHDRTNEQILLDLGFEKKEEDGFAPQVDSYYPFAVVYRVDDLTDGSFYIGMTEDEKKWDNGYTGSGVAWNRHLDIFPDHKYERTVLAYNFKTPKEARNKEREEIKRYCDADGKVDTTTGCMNLFLASKGIQCTPCSECGQRFGHKKTCSHYKEPSVCPECGGIRGCHRKSCSQYQDIPPCPECGGVDGKHKKTCPKYKEPDPCSECGGKFGHKKTCSHYKEPDACPECGVVKGHKKTCSHYKESSICPECGGVRGAHRKGCSQYQENPPCPECGGRRDKHKKGCSHYKDPKICPECGGKRGKHRKGCPLEPKCPECGYSVQSNMHAPTCSHYKAPGKCPECGYSLQSRRHAPACSHYKEIAKCPECGAPMTAHKKTCSKYTPKISDKVCPECGGKRGTHKKTCSQYKTVEACPECGGEKGQHKKTCSHYNAPDPCPECGAVRGHKKTCSKYRASNIKTCEICGGIDGKHKKTCPKYKAPDPCPECGKMYGHKSTCSKYKAKTRSACPECGSIGRHKKACSHYKELKTCDICGAKGGRHKKDCPNYKVPKTPDPCPECGVINGHMKTCSHYYKNRS